MAATFALSSASSFTFAANGSGCLLGGISKPALAAAAAAAAAGASCGLFITITASAIASGAISCELFFITCVIVLYKSSRSSILVSLLILAYINCTIRSFPPPKCLIRLTQSIVN